MVFLRRDLLLGKGPGADSRSAAIYRMGPSGGRQNSGVRPEAQKPATAGAPGRLEALKRMVASPGQQQSALAASPKAQQGAMDGQGQPPPGGRMGALGVPAGAQASQDAARAAADAARRDAIKAAANNLGGKSIMLPDAGPQPGYSGPVEGRFDEAIRDMRGNGPQLSFDGPVPEGLGAPQLSFDGPVPEGSGAQSPDEAPPGEVELGYDPAAERAALLGRLNEDNARATMAARARAGAAGMGLSGGTDTMLSDLASKQSRDREIAIGELHRRQQDDLRANSQFELQKRQIEQQLARGEIDQTGAELALVDLYISLDLPVPEELATKYNTAEAEADARKEKDAVSQADLAETASKTGGVGTQSDPFGGLFGMHASVVKELIGQGGEFAFYKREGGVIILRDDNGNFYKVKPDQGQGFLNFYRDLSALGVSGIPSTERADGAPKPIHGDL